jgi:hypothetical protein
VIAATILWNQFEDRGLMFSIPKTCQVLWLPDLIREHPGIAWLTLLRLVSVGKTDQILSDTPMRWIGAGMSLLPPRTGFDRKPAPS